MTDKELRKLSRLELLELLLEQAKENEALKAAAAADTNNSPAVYPDAPSIERIEQAAAKLDAAITHMNDALSKPVKEAPAQASRPSQNPTQMSPRVNQGQNIPQQQQYYAQPVHRTNVNPGRSAKSDQKLFWDLMSYFAKHEELLLYLPENLSREIKIRIEYLRRY